MKIKFIDQESLDTLKANVGSNIENYKLKDNQWIYDQLGKDPFIEYHKEVKEFKLEPRAKEIENAEVLYLGMKDITDSEATDERLWAGLAHDLLWEFMLENLEFSMEKTGQVKFIEKTIINRYFFNEENSTRKRRIFINSLSKLWWAGRLCYDEDNESDPFKYSCIFETAFSEKFILMSSSNIMNNKNTRFAYFRAGVLLQELGLEIKGKTMTPLQVYLNKIGGQVILDTFSVDEIYGMLEEYINDNLDEFIK